MAQGMLEFHKSTKSTGLSIGISDTSHIHDFLRFNELAQNFLDEFRQFLFYTITGNSYEKLISGLRTYIQMRWIPK